MAVYYRGPNVTMWAANDLQHFTRLRAYFHYGCALRCVASDSER